VVALAGGPEDDQQRTPNSSPPPLPAAANDTRFASLLGSPPPVAAGCVNGGWAWALAFAPIISVQLIQFIAGIIIETTPNVYAFNYYTHLERITLGLWWIYIAVYVLFSLMDINQLSKAGHDSPPGWLAIVFVPAYLYSRSKKLGQNQTLLIVWVVSLIATFFS
jgi:hypothetical protein